MRIILISIFILILGFIGILNPVRDSFQRFMVPVQFGLRRSALNIKDSFKLFYNLDNIRKENLALISENNALRSLVLDIKNIEQENSILKEQLNVSDSPSFFGKKLLLANVMGNVKDLTNTSLLVNRGSSSGVKVGDNVVLGSFLVGRVVKTTARLSEVELTVSPNFSATVIDLETQTQGIATGNLGTSIMVSKILAGENLDYNNNFVTTGKDGYYISGLSVGHVIHISQDSAQPVKTALLEPDIPLDKISEVFILIEEI